MTIFFDKILILHFLKYKKNVSYYSIKNILTTNNSTLSLMSERELSRFFLHSLNIFKEIKF